MVTDARTAMPTEQSILTLSQWISPSYPVGSFTYSHGLEALVNLQWLGNADSLCEWFSIFCSMVLLVQMHYFGCSL